MCIVYFEAVTWTMFTLYGYMTSRNDFCCGEPLCPHCPSGVRNTNWSNSALCSKWLSRRISKCISQIVNNVRNGEVRKQYSECQSHENS